MQCKSLLWFLKLRGKSHNLFPSTVHLNSCIHLISLYPNSYVSYAVLQSKHAQSFWFSFPQVLYDVREILEKNRDTFRDDILFILKDSRWVGHALFLFYSECTPMRLSSCVYIHVQAWLHLRPLWACWQQKWRWDPKNGHGPTQAHRQLAVQGETEAPQT